MATVSSVTSTIKTPENEEHNEAVVGRWRSKQTVSHQVSEPIGWPTPAAVDVVSIVDHRSQESVCTALLVNELLKTFFPLTGPGHVLGPDEHLSRSATLVLVMSSAGCFQNPNFIRQLFEAEKHGLEALAVIVDDNFHFPSDTYYQELRALSTHVLSATDPQRSAVDLITLIKNPLRGDRGARASAGFATSARGLVDVN